MGLPGDARDVLPRGDARLRRRALDAERHRGHLDPAKTVVMTAEGGQSMTTVDKRACPICGSGDVREARPTPEGERAVLGCAECDFVFVWPRIEQDFADVPAEAYYADWEMLDVAGTAGL